MFFKKNRTNNGHYIDSTTAAFEGDPTARLRRSGYSSYYHKYFEGYVEKQVPDSNGKMHIERTYVGNYHVHQLTDKQWVGLKILYALLYIVSCASLIFSTSLRRVGNPIWYLIIQGCTGLAVIALFFLLYTLVNYEIAQRKLTIWIFHESSDTIKNRCLVSAGTVGLVVLSEVIFLIANHSAADIGSWLGAIAGALISALCVLAIYYIESKVIKYDEIPSGNEGDSDAVSI